MLSQREMDLIQLEAQQFIAELLREFQEAMLGERAFYGNAGEYSRAEEVSDAETDLQGEVRRLLAGNSQEAVQ